MSNNNSPLEKWYPSLQRKINIYNQKVTDSLEVSKPKSHLFVLDGLRAVAFLAVLLYHCMYDVVFPTHLWAPSGKMQTLLAATLDFGESGVILFFLLSSFLLFLPFAKALLFEGQWPAIPRFYIRRICRILPGYYAAIFLMILFFHPEFLHSDHMMRLWELLTFSYSGSVSNQLNGPFWTMVIEFQFYMLLPLIAWIFSLIVRRGTFRWRLIKLVSCLLILLGWGLLSRWWGLFIDPSTPNFLQHVLVVLKPYYYSDSGKFFEVFAIGMLIAVIYVYTQNALNKEALNRKLQRWSLWMFLASLTILEFLAIWHYYYYIVAEQRYNPVFAFLNPYATPLFQAYLQWQALCYSICYGLGMCALLYSAGRLKRLFEWPVLRWIGLFSFSLYIWHVPFLFVYLRFMSDQFQGWRFVIGLMTLLAWVIFVIFPISLTLYRWIEMPGMRFGEVLIRRIEKRKKGSLTHVPNNPPVSETIFAKIEAVTVPMTAVSQPTNVDTL